MNRNDQGNRDYYPEDGDRTLVDKIQRTRLLEWGLLAVDLFALLFLESDVRDLARVTMPAWWLALIGVLHVTATVCLNAYLVSTLRYLCLYHAPRFIQSMPGAKRQKRFRSQCNLCEIGGALASGALIIVAIFPHFLIKLRPDYHFFGFVLAKFALFSIVMQLIYFFRIWLSIKAGIKEWRELREDYPTLSFPHYARYFDGYDESILM